MRLDRLSLENFRNYAAQEIFFDPSCNVICGENAQGKTNLLEAMVCLSTGKSHRTRTDRELIRFEQEGFRLSGTIHARNRDFTSRIDVGFGKKKRITVNEVPVRTASDLSAVLNTVFFCPEDLQLIKEGAAAVSLTTHSASCAHATPPPWRSTSVSMSIRPGYSGTAPTGRILSPLCRTSISAWRKPGPF